MQGMDIPDIDRVVQFMVPKSLCVWLQRYGRAGRAGQPSVVILLVEPSVFKRRKKRKRKTTNTNDVLGVISYDADEDWEDVLDEDGEDDDGLEAGLTTSVRDESTLSGFDDNLEYVKEIEDGLRLWVEGPGCRRSIANEYFDNPRNQRGEHLLHNVTADKSMICSPLCCLL